MNNNSKGVLKFGCGPLYNYSAVEHLWIAMEITDFWYYGVMQMEMAGHVIVWHILIVPLFCIIFNHSNWETIGSYILSVQASGCFQREKNVSTWVKKKQEFIFLSQMCVVLWQFANPSVCHFIYIISKLIYVNVCHYVQNVTLLHYIINIINVI